MTAPIAEKFKRLGSELPPVVPPVDSIVSRGRRRARRRRAANTFAASLAVAAGIVGVVGASTLVLDANRGGPDAAGAVTGCPEMSSFETLKAMPNDLPGGAEAVQLCPTFYWPLDRPSVVVMSDVDRLIEVVNNAMQVGTKSEHLCAMQARPTYFLSFTYADKSWRAVHATAPPSGTCDMLRIGTRRVMSGGAEVMAVYFELASDQR